MITNLRLLRFKRFAELRLTTRPLTILTGTNGSGKTSVIHALLLAQQSGNRTMAVVQLNGPDGLHLGEYADVLHHAADSTEGIVVEANQAGTTHRWRFSSADDRSLTLDIAERPEAPPAQLGATHDRHFTYLGANRLGPQDTLPAASAPPASMGVGHRGQYVAHVLAMLDRNKVSEGRRHPAMEPQGLLHQTEGWLRTITRPLEISAEWFPRSTVTRLLYKTPGARNEWVRPPNMGFGISTVLPIVVAGLVAERDGLFIVENPEIHLHPAGQSAIGRFLAQVAADGVQVLVETHSDHVINGIRRAVAEGVLPATDTVIQYFDQQVVEMTVNERGKLSKWPEGFFDQIDQDLGAIARRQRGR